MPGVQPGLPAATAAPAATPAAALPPSTPTAATPGALGSAQDLEKRAAQPVPAATLRASARRGNMVPGATGASELNQMTASTATGAGLPPAVSPEQKELTSAQQDLTDIRNKEMPVDKLMDKAKTIGSNPDSFLGRHPMLGSIARVGGEIGSGILGAGQRVLETALPGPMSGIPGTRPYQAQRAIGAEERITDDEKNLETKAKAGEEEATADSKKSMQSQIVAAKEKGFDLVQNAVTGGWEMKEDPTFTQRATAAKDVKPEIKVAGDGTVFAETMDPKNPTAPPTQAPVMDATGKQARLDPKKEYEYKEEVQADGKVHNVAYDKSNPSAKPIVLGLAKPSGSENSGKVYDNYAKQLETDAKPVEEKLAAANYLTTILANHDKQSDALVAPKLLSITTGGMGSGLKMNEAEISRVIGGRSVWDNLISTANSVQQGQGTFDDAQRAQISHIVSYMQTRSAAADYVISSARKAMLAAQNDDKAVKGISSHMHDLLSALDTHGVTPPGTGIPLKAGEFVYNNGTLYQIKIENGKAMGHPVEVN